MLLYCEEYTLCFSCKSNNIVSRAFCWQCGAALSNEATQPLARYAYPAQVIAPWSQTEMDSLLSQAILIDLSQSRPSPAAKRKSSADRAIAIRNTARREKQPASSRRVRINTVKRAATTLSLAFLSVAAASGPEAPNKPKVYSLHHGSSHKTAKRTVHAAPMLAKSVHASAGFSLETEMAKLREDIWARKQHFLTQALHMVSDYEAVHGPVIPLRNGKTVEANAPYPVYIACMKRALLQEGVL